ncbi:MAG: hypothetical protein HQK54_11305 [Oligoflexales bacterium]|nr:hypothetical protein [Oligoflexales bacterium]
MLGMGDANVQEILAKLGKLQEVDLVIDTIVRKKNLPSQELMELEKRITAENDKIVRKQEELKEIEKKKRQAEGALELGEERHKRNLERSSSIKSNEEYQAYLRENEMLKKNNEEFENSILLLMEDLEKGRKETVNLKEALERLEEQKAASKAKIEEENRVMERELEQKNTERGGILGDIDQKSLMQYERIKKCRQGIALAQVVNGSCKGCNMAIPPQLFNLVIRGDKIYQCPNCTRIIFFKKPDEAAN